MTILRIEPEILEGKSKQQYEFTVCSIDSKIPDVTGVYILALYRRVKNEIYIYNKLYCDKASKLRTEINQHKIGNYDNPNCVCILITDSVTEAIDIALDLGFGNVHNN